MLTTSVIENSCSCRFRIQYYAIYVGEQWEDHRVNWAWFHVNENFTEVLWENLAGCDFLTLDEWRNSPQYLAISSMVDDGFTEEMSTKEPTDTDTLPSILFMGETMPYLPMPEVSETTRDAEIILNKDSYDGKWNRTNVWSAMPSSITINNVTEEGFDFDIKAFFWSHQGYIIGEAVFMDDSHAISTRIMDDSYTVSNLLNWNSSLIKTLWLSPNTMSIRIAYP